MRTSLRTMTCRYILGGGSNRLLIDYVAVDDKTKNVLDAKTVRGESTGSDNFV